ncbi:MAG: hypothetical protein IT214_13160 [Chitinophagaceae bacterium]|jgi:hypothetical protein|nr:hypothetical protein [Chitinophagaceae bacterium]OQY93856.1 MAG: hypothetical protein B6D37_10355 [Sphingobacteriales bacterium UTBCD1]
MKDTRRFYKELGNLFYAIASADKKIGPQEKKKLDEEVQFAWRHYDDTTDRFGSDRAFLIEFEFETLEDQMASAEEAYQSFETYFKDNKAELDEATRKRIFNSARHIAESIHRINIPEHKYLDKLKKLLKI